MPVKIKWAPMSEHAVIPQKAHDGDACFDLTASEDMTINPGWTMVVPTGLAVEIPYGYEMQIRPRSGISVNTSILVILGTIDPTYRGSIGIIAKNLSNYYPYVIKRGDRIAQACIQPVLDVEHVTVSPEELSSTPRGKNGFGSTGVGVSRNDM